MFLKSMPSSLWKMDHKQHHSFLLHLLEGDEFLTLTVHLKVDGEDDRRSDQSLDHQKCEDHTCEDQRFAKEGLKQAKSCNVSRRHHWHQSATQCRAGTGQFISLQLSHAIFHDSFILSKILGLKQAEVAISCYLVLRGISLNRLMRQIVTTVQKEYYK